MDDSQSSLIEHQIDSLPPLPLTVSRVMEVTSDPQSSANDLVKAILPDQTMCVAVLKIANSALYGRPRKVSSLETAIMVLGFQEIQSIVLGKAAVVSFKPLLSAYREELEVFWDHAFTCGLAARIIGDHISLPSGQFFIAGLLHDIGKLALLMSFGDAYTAGQALTAFTTAEGRAAERRAFTASHDLIGSRLLQHWQFPELLVTALRYHHDPLNAPRLQGYPLVIQLADFLSHMCVRPETPDEHTLKSTLAQQMPDFEALWRRQNLPWEDTTLESWFAWLKVDRTHGSEILDILAA